MPICIYCREVKAAEEFNREHVLQAGFGQFKDAPTLHGAVCEACNQLFGNSIDRELQRHGVEGLERYQWGAKQPEQVDKFQYSNVTLRILEAGDFTGAQIQLMPSDTGEGMQARLVASVRFCRRDGTGFVDYVEAQIAAGEWLGNEEIDWRLGFQVYGDEEAVERLMGILAEQGAVPSQRRQLVMPRLDAETKQVEVAYSITEGMYRAIAKVAFNYLAYVVGVPTSLSASFDPIRRFIRYGEASASPSVITRFEMPYTMDAGAARPVMHFVGLTMHKSHANLLGEVSLFGVQTHTVMLAEDYPGPWPRQQAHVYNLMSRQSHLWLAGTVLDLSPRPKGGR